MEEDWNDLAQSEKDEPKLLTRSNPVVVLINGILLGHLINLVRVYMMWSLQDGVLQYL